ncbi:MAG: hypothetical protein A2W11_00435 [Ignavibacteria bacterium RBG_16_35_7]|nr:MAG: hypothetical protein A2W11_00435 [Ignavibacteria bacterium RBG_16_35_7]
MCQKNRKLCKSHVIPEFLYKAIYDDKHRANEITIEPFKKKFIQKGYYEELLCKECEEKISRLEKYCKENFFDNIPQNIKTREYEADNLDYNKFILFHLSILWRASISSRKEFKNVRLDKGPHEELIRKLLENQISPSYEDYSFFGKLLVHQGKVIQDLIYEPINTKYKAHHVYVFTFGGAQWYYLVSSHSKKEFSKILFKEDGKLILRVEELLENTFFKDSILKYQKSKSAKR